MVSLQTKPILIILLLLLATIGSDHCRNEQWPKIVPGKNIYKLINEHLYATYNEDITLICSSNNTPSVTIQKNEDKLEIQRLNSTTIIATHHQLRGKVNTYFCTDNKTNCKSHLLVKVRPAMSVTASHVQHKVDEKGYNFYLVPREPFNLTCSGNDIKFATYYKMELPVTRINATTITTSVTDGKEGVYFCLSELSDYEMYESISIVVDNFPEAHKFRCVLYDEQELKCTWISSSTRNNYELYRLHGQKNILFWSGSSENVVGGCVVKLDSIVSPIYGTLFFKMRTCNGMFCNNQTFTYNSHYSITKLKPPDDVHVHNKTSSSAIVSWSIQEHYASYCRKCVYKVEYRLLGTDWRMLNASTVQCEYNNTKALCQLQLVLPCPNAHYELRLYVRHNDATEDIYWSEPTHVYFFTASSFSDAVTTDPACSAEFIDLKPPPTAAMAFNDVRKLINDERKAISDIKGLVAAMRLKLAKIKDLMNNDTSV